MRRPPSGRELAFLLLAMGYPTVAAWGYFVAFADDPRLRALYLASKIVQAALPLLGWWALRMPRGPAPWRPRGVAAGLASGAVLAGLVLLAWWGPLARWQALAPVPRQVWERLVALGFETPLRYLALAALLSVAHSLFEEYYWRWFVFAQTERWLRPWLAVGVSSLAFAAHHGIVLDAFLAGGEPLVATLPLTLAVAAAGVVWCWLFRRHGSLVAPWLSHLLVDAALMALGYRLVWGTGGPARLG